jgi:hypothetical protein
MRPKAAHPLQKDTACAGRGARRGQVDSDVRLHDLVVLCYADVGTVEGAGLESQADRGGSSQESDLTFKMKIGNDEGAHDVDQCGCRQHRAWITQVGVWQRNW